LLHVKSDDWQHFDRWAAVRFSEMTRTLRHVQLTGTRAAAAAAEQSFGLNYCGGVGLVWGDARMIASIPETVCFDSMHTVFSHSGVAQLECAQFLRCIVAAGVPLTMITSFLTSFYWAGSKALPRFLVEERWVPDGGGGLRTFAGEIVALLPCLLHFARCVLKPMHKLLEHVECLELLFALTSLLFRDECVQQIPKMRHLLEAHHRLFARLYPLACRPKLHYLHHVVDGIERQQVHLNCFGSERKHKEAKAVASFCFRDFAVSIMQRCCLAHVEALLEPQAVQLNVLFGKLKRTRVGWTGKCMRHAAGLLSHREFCMVEGVGHIIVFFECIATKEAVPLRACLPPAGSMDPLHPTAPVPGKDMHYLCVRRCLAVVPGQWRDVGAAVSRLPASVPLIRCMCMRNDNDYFPVLPSF
jgi:hypothetical protein